MEFAHVLGDLDAHSWSDVSHAYGSAEELPDALRVLAGEDGDAADAALSELYDSVLHQGTVYAASALAVPFLAGIAASGRRTEDVLVLLGGMAESEDEHEVAPGAVRAAVASELPVLLPLLDAADPGVRRAAAWAVSHTRATATVLPALRARWDEDSEPSVRAEVLAGISRLDRPLGAVTATTVLDPSHAAELRMAAVFACLDGGLPWTAEHHMAMLSLLPAGPLVALRLDPERGEPLAAVVADLLRRHTRADREAAFALLGGALRDDRAEVRAEALWAAEQACGHSRSAPERLLPGVIAAAVGDEAMMAVASLVGGLGTAAAQAAPVLAAPAGRNPDGNDDHADRALAALVLVAPRRAAPLLARGLGRRPRALDAAAGFRAPADPPFPYDGELLDAVRSRLGRPEALGTNEPWQLTRLLAGWRVRAAAALPQLYALLARFPGQVAPAVAAIAADCPPGERALAASTLRTAAVNGSLPAAKALYDLTGEHENLLGCLSIALRRGSRELAEAAGTAGALGPRAIELAPALRAALSGADGSAVGPVLDADTALAEALWHISQDGATVVGALDSVFFRAGQSPWSRWYAVRAARVTALLGPVGRPLTARLETLLSDPEQVPAAVLALVAVADPAALDRSSLAEAVLDAAEREADAMGAIEALEALGADSLSPSCLRRLAALAEGDARVIRSGVEGQVIRRDEALRDRARTLLSAFAPPST